MKPAERLNDFGQSAWLDLIGRKLIRSGELKRMAEEDGIRGVTANPAIFEKAIVESDEYDDDLSRLIAEGKSPLEIYETLAIADVRAACDVLRPWFDKLRGADGFVSLEVSPYIARDTKATVAEAKRFWKAVDRPNLFIKIPANPEGIPAIRQSIAAGLSINITLIFSVRVYQQVIDAYLSGLEERLSRGEQISQIHSVASFFVSRVDTAVDKLLEQKGVKDLQGKIANANAKEAYQVFLKTIASPRWKALEAKGATRQRPLWASTGTKNKAYSDVHYVEPLIGKDTVNTMPLGTLQAFNDHGKVAETITQGVEEARAQLRKLAELGIDLEQVCKKLTDDGLELFSKALDGLLHAIEARAAAQRSVKQMQLSERLGKGKDDAARGIELAREKKAAARLWARDASLWGEKNVAKDRLGWLDSTRFVREQLGDLNAFARQAAERFRHCLLLGMGGSSLCPDVLARVLGKREGGLELRVLDSTAPDAVRNAAKGFDLDKTLFLVSSKSGTTAEVSAFYRHYRAKIDDGSHFVAITDPGSPLHKLSEKEKFWRAWLNPPDIGGRYSALSWFGLVPAALLGLDVGEMLKKADEVALASQPQVPVQENLALRLGAIASGLAKNGADKLTLLLSKGLLPFGGWVEQLIAESTGKKGRGIVPVSGEPPGKNYGSDRLFVALSLASDALDVGYLAEGGHPLLQWKLASPLDLAGEFLRWEIATAVMGALLEIDPFDEPNVAEAKEKTKAILRQPQAALEPSLRAQGLALFASPEHGQVLRKGAGTQAAATPAGWIAAHLALAQPGDYVALLAYLPPTGELENEFHQLQGAVREATKAACTFGFGPRYLHSTGQLHKGGPNTGLFLQITSDGGEELSIPGESYGFRALFAAQARGDLEVLQAHGRRVLRVHVEDDKPDKALAALREGLQRLAK
ncbi:MAG: bifunctional transaldolase/phosoglucose isomerase [Deltaproteobacteria bacterium]|nr:MAG: bifunctional transaldolase/phosoglucose isomerase [Deltaproteobacteria bacterium]